MSFNATSHSFRARPNLTHGVKSSLSNSDDTTQCETSLKLKELLIFPPTGTRVIQELKRQVGLEKTRSLLRTMPFCF